MFQAIDEEIEFRALDPKLMLAGKYSLRIKIKSAKEWKDTLEKYVLTYKTAHIYDEYERLIDYDTFYRVAFQRSEENKEHALEYPEGSFIDSEGYSLIISDFS